MVVGEVLATAANVAIDTAKVVVETSAKAVAETAKTGIETSAKAAENVIGKSGVSLDGAKSFLDKKFVSFDEIPEKLGGKYADLKNDIDPISKVNTTEKNHIPPDCASKLDRNEGPALKMDKADHRQTSSCGNSKEARAYNKMQKELVDQGKFREAVQNDLDDIRSKFGDKYEVGISQLLEYVDELELKGVI